MWHSLSLYTAELPYGNQIFSLHLYFPFRVLCHFCARLHEVKPWTIQFNWNMVSRRTMTVQMAVGKRWGSCNFSCHCLTLSDISLTFMFYIDIRPISLFFVCPFRWTIAFLSFWLEFWTARIVLVAIWQYKGQFFFCNNYRA